MLSEASVRKVYTKHHLTWTVYTHPTSIWLWGMTNVRMGSIALFTDTEKQNNTSDTTERSMFPHKAKHFSLMTFAHAQFKLPLTR